MDKNYYKHHRVEVRLFLPEKIEKSLDIGCSEGIFSEYIKQNYNAETWGIEIDSVSAEIAKNKLDKVLVGDAISSLSKLPLNYFDCIICNDIIEHLLDSKLFIEVLHNNLKKDGSIVCSIPNVRYWHNILNLLIKKDWHYTTHGILDNTHFRFFTKKSIERMFTEAGYSVEIIKGINPTPSIKFKLINLITFGFISDMKFLQFGVRVKK